MCQGETQIMITYESGAQVSDQITACTIVLNPDAFCFLLCKVLCVYFEFFLLVTLHEMPFV